LRGGRRDSRKLKEAREHQADGEGQQCQRNRGHALALRACGSTPPEGRQARAKGGDESH
jgi:hypothetical protein